MKEYQKKNRRSFAGAMVCVLLSTIFATVLQFSKGGVLDTAVAGEVGKTLRYAAVLVGLILCEVLFFYWYRRCGNRFVAGCTRMLKQDIFRRILDHSYVAYKEQPQGEYLARYTNEADAIKTRRFEMLPLFWEILFRILFVSAALFLLDWRIALITIGLTTTPLYIPKIIEKRLQKAQSAHLLALEEGLSHINNWLSGFELIKNFSIEKRILDRFKQINDRSMETMLQDAQLGAVAQLITALISYLSYFGVMVCSTWLVLRGDFSAGDFFVAIGMIDQLSYPLISLAGITRQLISVKPACTAMESFLNTPENRKPVSGPETFRAEIRFEGVGFSYDGQRAILKDFDLTIQKGKRYLLKGPSGCGKTTAINLLLRYYDVNAGRITIDGVPIENIGSTYGCISVVRQEATVFHDTLRNNLTMYRDISDRRLMEMLCSVGLSRFANVEALDSMVTEDGANFSGGEKKRICLARALLREGDILILDEPLANLDDSTAERIEDLLLSIEGKTLLVVSHQFTGEKMCRFDRVVEFGRNDH